MSEPTWQDASGKKWAKNQEKMDAQLGPLSASAFAALELEGGETVLDVGCGTGQTLLELRERVGPTGRVIGLDISPPMLELARARVTSRGYENVECLLGDASEVRPASKVDAIFSRFGVMFFEDSVKAFRNLLGSLRPHGRISFICWQSLDDNPWATEPMAAVRRIVPDAPLGSMLRAGEPGPFRFGDRALLEHALTSAGFQDVRITPEVHQMVLGGASTLDGALECVFEIGPAARMMGEAAPELRPRFEEALRATLALRLTERGVVYPAALFVVSARAPSGEEIAHP